MVYAGIAQVFQALDSTQTDGLLSEAAGFQGLLKQMIQLLSAMKSSSPSIALPLAVVSRDLGFIANVQLNLAHTRLGNAALRSSGHVSLLTSTFTFLDAVKVAVL